MTELKEKITSNTQKKLIQELAEFNAIPGNVSIDRLKLIIRGVLRDELGDMVVIDRKKLKDKLSVVMYDDGLKSIYFKTGVLCRKECDRMEFFTKEKSITIDQMKDHIKEEFIGHLEECDFE